MTEQKTRTTCPSCPAGELTDGTTTLTLTREHQHVDDPTTYTLHVVVENVPAQVCEVCGETLIDSAVVERAHQLAEHNTTPEEGGAVTQAVVVDYRDATTDEPKRTEVQA